MPDGDIAITKGEAKTNNIGRGMPRIIIGTPIKQIAKAARLVIEMQNILVCRDDFKLFLKEAGGSVAAPPP